MSAPLPDTVHVPFASDALPATPTLPTSVEVHDDCAMNRAPVKHNSAQTAATTFQ